MKLLTPGTLNSYKLQPFWSSVNYASNSYFFPNSNERLEVDDQGNSYIVGYFTGTANFSSISLNSSGSQDGFVAKLDSNNNFLWAKKISGTQFDSAASISKIDSNLMVCGFFTNSATFDSITLTAASTQDAFVALIDQNGNWLWAITTSGSGSAYPYSITRYSDTEALITGYFSGTVTFGSSTISTTNSSGELFVAKINSSGSWQWSIKASGVSNDIAYSISRTSDGGAVLCGVYVTQISLGSTTLTTQQDTVAAFIAKIDSNGNWIWAKKIDSPFSGDGAAKVVSQNNGDSYVIGYSFLGTLFFDSFQLSGTQQFLFIAKIDSNGNWIWASKADGPNNETGLGGDIVEDGIILTGTFSSDALFGTKKISTEAQNSTFVAKIDFNGNWKWAISQRGSGNSQGNSVKCKNGKAIVCGNFTGSQTFGKNQISSSESFNTFVAQVENV